ncbi:MAG: ANTAR domain-containing protein [Planctomycetaceae bacterium]
MTETSLSDGRADACVESRPLPRFATCFQKAQSRSILYGNHPLILAQSFMSRSSITAVVQALNIIVAHGLEDARDVLSKTLRALKYEQVRVCTRGHELIATAQADPPDLIIAGVDLPDMDGPTALIEISREVTVPAIVVTQQRSLDIVQKALEDHVMAYLIEPIKSAEILPTIYLVLKRFEQFQELQAENESLKQALAERKLIDRAKGILMKRAGIDEETAYKRLRRLATNNRIRMAEAANRVMSVDDVFDPDEET